MQTNFSLRLQEIGHGTPKRAFTPSSLLVPKSCLDFFGMRKKEFGSINAYFLHLLAAFGKNLAQFGITPQKTTRKWKIKYQQTGQELKKTSFVPDPCAWEAYRAIASLHGLSICHFFVILLELDMQSWHNLGCPERQGPCGQAKDTKETAIPSLPDTEPALTEMGPNGWLSKIKNRNNYPSLELKALKRLYNITKTAFFKHEVDFESQTLTRSGYFLD